MVFNYFTIKLLNCHLPNTVAVPDVVFDNPIIGRDLIVLVGADASLETPPLPISQNIHY